MERTFTTFPHPLVRNSSIFLGVLVVSLYLHEAVHWFVYSVYGVPAWISLQRVRTLATPQDEAWLMSLISGPLFTLGIGIVALRLLRDRPQSITLFSVAFINGSNRIAPNLFAIPRLLRNAGSGFSDEGNFAIGILPNPAFQIGFVLMFVAVSLYLTLHTVRYLPLHRWKVGAALALFGLSFALVIVLGVLDNWLFP